MKSLAVFILVILLSNSNKLLADVLADVLGKHRQTLGNIEAWKTVKNLTYHLDIKEPKFSVKGTYRVTRNGKMRIDIFSGGQHVFTEAFNGRTGWQWNQGDHKPKIIKGKKSATLRHGVELPGRIHTLLDMQNNGHQLEYIGEEIWQGIPAHLLRLELKDGHQKWYILKQKTGLILANRDTRAFHPDIDNTEVLVETRLTDFKEFQGMKRSFGLENWDLTNNQLLGKSEVIDLKMNAFDQEAFFEIENFSALTETQAAQ